MPAAGACLTRAQHHSRSWSNLYTEHRNAPKLAGLVTTLCFGYQCKSPSANPPAVMLRNMPSDSIRGESRPSGGCAADRGMICIPSNSRQIITETLTIAVGSITMI